MAYPDGTAVIRYYPVDLVSETREDAQIGLGLWVSNTTSSVNYTLASLDGGLVGWTQDEAFTDQYLGTITIPVPSSGSYSERAFILLDEFGVAVPISGGDLPIELFLSRAKYNSPGGYAGGVVQVGVYAGGGFVPLSSFELAGVFFPAFDVAPGAWELLPPINPSSVIEDSPPKLVLDGVLPVSFFWTQLRKVVETP
jgi:hypothetical protein